MSLFFAAIAGSGVLFLAPTDARADARSEARAAAKFEEARVLIERGDYGAACPKFAESESIEPSGRAIFNLGDCYEHVRKYASALSAFEDALKRARDAHRPDIAAIAEKRVIELAPKVSRLVIERSGAQDVAVKIDGVLVVFSVLGPEGLALDFGEHTLTASAPGKRAWTKTLFFSDERPSQRVTVPVLDDAVTAPKIPDPRKVEETPDATWRTVGIVAGSAGVVAVGVGVALGIGAAGQLNHVNAICPNGVCPSASFGTASSDLNGAESLATASTICIVAGAVFAVVGVTFAIANPQLTARTASFTLGPGSASFRAEF